MDKHQDIINILKATPSIEPPDDFTPRVMVAVMKANKHACARLWNYVFRPREIGAVSNAALLAESGNLGLAWHFLIAGFVYAIIGTSLFIGFSEFKNVGELSEWISLQPFFWLASALMFVLCGVALRYTGGQQGFNLARSYLFFHIGFAIINGIFISLSSALPLTIMFAVLFAIPVAIIGSPWFIGDDNIKKLLTRGEIFSHVA